MFFSNNKIVKHTTHVARLCIATIVLHFLAAHVKGQGLQITNTSTLRNIQMLHLRNINWNLQRFVQIIATLILTMYIYVAMAIKLLWCTYVCIYVGYVILMLMLTYVHNFNV